MTERKLRYLFRSMHDDYALGGYYKMVAAAMAEEPDMVGLLRWAYEQLEYAGGGGEEAALRLLIERLEKQVDLSDEPPGWEWADDGFQNPEQWDKPDCMP